MATNRSVANLSDDDLETFAETLDGDLILTDHPEYDDARDVWNGLVDKHPAVIARVSGPDDVAAALTFASEHDLAFSIRGNGHQQAGSALVDDGLVIDLADLTEIDVDPEQQVATVEPGLTVGEALTATQEYGLAFPTGSASTVGISGSTLGGGIGWMRRKHGLGIDALRSVELVTATGEVLTVSPEENPDLFRAVCGAGANFGIVTEFTFDLSEVGPEIQSLGVFYHPDDIDTVLEQYRQLTAETPDELTTILLHGEVPHLPDLPDEVAGSQTVAIMGCYIGDHDEGARVIKPFTEIAEPMLDMSGVIPYLMLHELGAEMFPDGDLYCQRSVFVDDLTDAHLDVVKNGKGGEESPANGIGIWSMGGAVGTGNENVVPWDDKQYLLSVEAHWFDDEATPTNLEWARSVEQDLRVAGGAYAYGGFTGIEEQDGEDWPSLVYGDEYEHLADLKAQYDPENRFRLNVNIEPSEH